MNSDDVLDEFRAAGALREGHFVLSSGLHSPIFLQKNLVFMGPSAASACARPWPRRSPPPSARSMWRSRRPSAASSPATRPPVT
jgi:hypothetical protein